MRGIISAKRQIWCTHSHLKTVNKTDCKDALGSARVLCFFAYKKKIQLHCCTRTEELEQHKFLLWKVWFGPVNWCFTVVDILSAKKHMLLNDYTNQCVISCWRLTIETRERGVKYAQS